MSEHAATLPNPPVAADPSVPRRAQFRCLDPLRVRWAEVDLQKIVFNGHYLMYFDTAVAAYWRQMAMPYHETMHALGGDLYVRKATLEYLASARYDEQLHIGMRLLRLGRSSMTLQACAFRGEKALVHGEIVYVYADPTTQTSRPMPPALREWIEAFEAGESMVQVRVGDWEALRPLATPIRERVFVGEQGIPRELELDELDAVCVHAVALNRLGGAVGTGRLLPAQNGVARIGRMAVTDQVRGAGVGQAVLAALMEAARQRGDTAIELHAQLTAERFYAGRGFRRSSEPYEEAGLPHVKMRAAL